MQKAMILAMVVIVGVSGTQCPSSHPLEGCGRCWVDAAQARSGGCGLCEKDADCAAGEWCKSEVAADTSGAICTEQRMCAPRVGLNHVCEPYAPTCLQKRCMEELVCQDVGATTLRGVCKHPTAVGCTTECGRSVPHGWEGNNDGLGYCNTCRCDDGALLCTKKGCVDQRSPVCLADGDECADRSGECPDGSDCVADAEGVRRCKRTACTTDDDCASDEWCNSLKRSSIECTKEKKCRKRVGEGKACGGTRAICWQDRCLPGLSCSEGVCSAL